MLRALFLPLALPLALLSAPLAAQEFPLTIDHRFGQTAIPDRPARVATLDYAGADDLLALGVQPVALRYWYGDHPRAVWPWAEPLLEGAPEILRGQINFEQVAAAKPDVIIALWSGIDRAAYDRLSQIAPVVAPPRGVDPFALPWDDRAMIAGRAVGREDLARRKVAEIDALFDAAAEDHPHWQGLTATVAYMWDDRPGVYGSQDIRAQILSRLGFETPAAVDAGVPGGGFSTDISAESIGLMEADVILWFATDGDFSGVEALPTRRFLEANDRGDEIFVDALLAGAFSHASLLSLPYTLDHLVPALEEVLPAAD
ncbi:iron-siderophore ABC transporter substrate-binding protein [Mesobaculum littorinae]|uniref:Iron-siderophore ABC transporter substrate-binding protein n=1 Tax=Mesobaculum littorinae TaxID=2486419 RepID=A0A438AKT1_9RHOB|nr:ABC transporter substrate-binding protein [Mesobaculum littorinae]RVV99433.1 iron-siderophore ABC transporter substrate-binding protein [Mesobaculum littorinae]